MGKLYFERFLGCITFANKAVGKRISVWDTYLSEIEEGRELLNCIKSFLEKPSLGVRKVLSIFEREGVFLEVLPVLQRRVNLISGYYKDYITSLLFGKRGNEVRFLWERVMNDFEDFLMRDISKWKELVASISIVLEVGRVATIWKRFFRYKRGNLDLFLREVKL